MAKNKVSAKKRIESPADLRDRLCNICDVIQTVCDAITSDGRECTCAAMVLSLYGLEPLLEIKDELAERDEDDDE
jgi:hypothetical protein